MWNGRSSALNLLANQNTRFAHHFLYQFITSETPRGDLNIQSVWVSRSDRYPCGSKLLAELAEGLILLLISTLRLSIPGLLRSLEDLSFPRPCLVS